MLMRAQLRWWLWTCFTFVVMAVAAVLGFFDLLLKHDVTYLGVTVIGLYVLASAWIGVNLRKPDVDFGFVEHIAKVMSYIGVLGTFIGFAIAFQGLAPTLSQGTIPPAAKSAFMAGVLTKFYCSIVGIIGYLFLETQVRLLERR